ncbi:MAG: DUF167 domain-containing protein [Candidatus Euphemobacter frigidus]|nr:DUF167 domain-containing protein [Candidatus Euphemobacter frigidus]MDP8275287.1 DUF167 domain-containing protein [Candidatus Euphemobacter frigidus]
MKQLKISKTNSQVRFRVRLRPRSGRNRIAGIEGGRLKIEVAAAPVDNKANRELIKLLSKKLRLPRRSIIIRLGATSRDKLIGVNGLSPGELLRRLQITK